MVERATLLPSPPDDVQGRRPRTHLSLSRVGVTGVEKIVRMGARGHDELFYARLDCFVDLNPKQKGAHMSRFEETVNEAIDEVVLGESFRAETLAARYPERKHSPATGIPTQEIFTLLGSAVASETGVRRLVGVQAQGMTACPCAQELIRDRSRERLAADGFSDDEIERVFEHVPAATHNQRGLGTLHVGSPQAGEARIEASTLLRIVEASMSSEVYELMKRPDEAEVVERAHSRPRFVEDCVRESLRLAVEEFARLGDAAFVMARQENLETIHRHDVVAERHGLLGEVRRELTADEPSTRHVTMREWLNAGDLKPSATRD